MYAVLQRGMPSWVEYTFLLITTWTPVLLCEPCLWRFESRLSLDCGTLNLFCSVANGARHCIEKHGRLWEETSPGGAYIKEISQTAHLVERVLPSRQEGGLPLDCANHRKATGSRRRPRHRGASFLPVAPWAYCLHNCTDESLQPGSCHDVAPTESLEVDVEFLTVFLWAVSARTTRATRLCGGCPPSGAANHHATPSAGRGFGSDLATLGANPRRAWCPERPQTLAGGAEAVPLGMGHSAASAWEAAISALTSVWEVCSLQNHPRARFGRSLYNHSYFPRFASAVHT